MNLYEEFNEETKSFLNKAMDIYLTIKDKDIKQRVRKIGSLVDYQFTKLDKKVMSLFIAGFIVDGNLKEILGEYDDIKLKDLFSFINITEEQVLKLNEDEYSDFYSKNFRLDLVSIMKERMWGKEVNHITPEVIVSSLQFISLSGSDVLDFFGKKYDIKGIFFSEHPVFDALENYTLMDGSVSKKYMPKRNNLGGSSSLFGLSFGEKNTINPDIQVDKRKVNKFNFEGDKIWSILDDIQKKFIGQEIAAEDLFYNIVNNQQLALRDDVSDGERSIIFLDGPTGTGKTAITREITDKLDIPFTATSATNYSSTGYVGGNITDTLKELYNKAGEDIEKAQRGIIVFDEFDKLAYSRSGGLEMKKAVQQQLLDFMGGGKYTITVGSGLFSSQQVEFDTSKLTFVCLAALSDLRNEKTEVKSSIGFGGNVGSTKVQEYTITPQDLIGIGLERELVGRLNTFLHTKEYSKEDLLKILKESTISPLLGFEKWVTSKGKTLAIGEDVYGIIVDAAYDLNTGARSLQTIMNNIRTRYLKEVMRGISKEIKLDKETVLAITEGTFNRRGRR